VNSQAKARKAWGSLFAACAGAVLVAVLALAVAVGGIPLLVQGRALTVYGDSMKPAFGRGDVIVIRGVKDPDSIKTGQIISYRTDGAGSPVATRRVVDQTDHGSGRRWIVQSDADQVREEDSVAENQIVGVYMYRIPKLGYAVSWASEHGIAVILAGLVAVLAAAVVVLVVALRRRSGIPGWHGAPGDGNGGKPSAGSLQDGPGAGAPPAGAERPLAAERGRVDGGAGQPGRDGGQEPQTGRAAGRPGGREPQTGRAAGWPERDAVPRAPQPPPSGAASAAPPRRRADAKRADLLDTLTGVESLRPKPVPWLPGPGRSNDRPAPRSGRDVPTWDDVAAEPSRPAPRLERLVTTRPETLAKPVAFVPTGPAMEGHSTGELPVRHPRRIAGEHSLADKIPHARVPVHPTGDMPPVPLLSEDALLVASPPAPARRSGPPIAARIPRAQTPPSPPPPLPAVRIERALPFHDGPERGPVEDGRLGGWPQRSAGPERMERGPLGAGQGSGGAFEPLKQRAAQVMHETGELRLVRESRKPRVISRNGSPPADDQR
jgi:signal peptidase